ncbi:MAG: serine kinase [Deltaproteobacteria bacterium]|nr:serine kinase [Deltaproteobacteria bacterium]
MDIEAVIGSLNLEVLSGKERLKTEVRGGYTGDLLSDVMANSKEGDLWITRQTHPNIVAVASLKEHAGIILVAGSEPAGETLERAANENIPIMVSELSGFEVTGRLYNLITKKESETVSQR